MRVTPEMVEALATLRSFAERHKDNTNVTGLRAACRAFNTLDNADVFVPLDDASEVDEGSALDFGEWGDTTRADMARHQQD